MKVLWCIRDYRDVVASMIKLTLDLNGKKVPWAMHPAGGLREIKTCSDPLKDRLSMELKGYLEKFNTLMANYANVKYSDDEIIFLAALCWRLKQEQLPLYDENQIDYRVVYYENVIQEPEDEIKRNLNFLGVEWHENVLKHHELHSGFSVGKTDNTRPIDKSNMRNWLNAFTPDQMKIITEICGNMGAKFGYDREGW